MTTGPISLSSSHTRLTASEVYSKYWIAVELRGRVISRSHVLDFYVGENDDGVDIFTIRFTDNRENETSATALWKTFLADVKKIEDDDIRRNMHNLLATISSKMYRATLKNPGNVTILDGVLESIRFSL